MIPTILIDELTKYLRESVKDFKMQAESQKDKKISVYAGYLPEENYRADTFLPFIVVELRNVVDTDEGSFAEIGLCLAVYGGETLKDGSARELTSGFKNYGDGWRDLHNLAEKIRQSLLNLPSRILAEQFSLQLPIIYRPQEVQPHPFFYGDMLMTFEIGQPNFHFN